MRQKTTSKIEPVGDGFWDVNVQEERIRKDLDTRIASAESAMLLAGRVSSIQSHPGFQSFLRAIEDLRTSRVRELVCCDKDSFARIQGGIRELDNVLTVLKKAKESEEKLAKNLQKLQDQRSAIVGTDGRIRRES